MEIVPFKGLADHPYEYQFRVKAKDSSGAVPESDYSDVITIVDSPIKSVNGDSREGEMKIRWHTAGSGAQYTVRWRKISNKETNSHTSENWRPVEWRSSHAGSEYDWDSETTSSHSYDIDNEDRGIVEGEIYDATVNMEPHRVFAARDVYVWPSDKPREARVPNEPPRVATFPFIGHLRNSTYQFRVCMGTFPPFSSVTTTSPPAPEQIAWAKMIAHALKQWETATNIVTMNPDFKTGGTHANPLYEPCTEYDPTAGSVFPLPEMDKDWFKRLVEQDNQINEILMISFPYQKTVDRGSLQELMLALDPLKGCMLYTNSACAAPAPDYDRGNVLLPQADALHYSPYVHFSPFWLPQSHAGAELTSSDILLNSDKFSMVNPNIPDAVKFNTCVIGTTPDPNDDDESDDFYAYATIVHEGGHALGLAGRKWNELLSITYSSTHSSTPGSVMNYDGVTNVNEPDCAPHPLDVLAIYALYQTLSP